MLAWTISWNKKYSRCLSPEGEETAAVASLKASGCRSKVELLLPWDAAPLRRARRCAPSLPLKPSDNPKIKPEVRTAVVEAEKSTALNRVIRIQHMEEPQVNLLGVPRFGDKGVSAFK